ncbi:RHS repeat protein [Frankia sp. AgPm24]|uniref:RHS repeat domain-containing protein n=1 Tax=Frankia sp. AgPm24 TaxID=631128 RepID=UPI00201067B4|nr:RHS repeat domain-containing protein [Frankia sp. AgPm24]MCK9923651.1 RHS repeat protein [Frankia sp. AgPm24]
MARRETYGYDWAGRWVWTSSPSGARTLYRRDDAGRLTALVTPAGRETTWEYDARGQLAAWTDPLGGHHHGRSQHPAAPKPPSQGRGRGSQGA